jgi:hypothetical protein
LVYSPALAETKVSLDENKDISNHSVSRFQTKYTRSRAQVYVLKFYFKIKQRILERLNESAESVLKSDESNEEDELKSDYKLDRFQMETLNIILNYVDFYNPNVDIKSDTKNKFAYSIHALNHTLK